MKFNNTDDDDKRDFFDGPDVDDTREEKKPKYKRDDPRYYEGEESEWEHLKPRRSMQYWILLGVAAVVIALMVAMYTRFFSPYITDATQIGYVESIEERGTVFKTYEGVLLPYKELMDTTRVYDHDFVFTAENEKVASELRRMQNEVRPVRVRYKMYHATVPWRGSAKIVITAVDTVDPARVLPPDRTPKYYKEGTYRTDTVEQNAIKARQE